jgi:hypothetical protein
MPLYRTPDAGTSSFLSDLVVTEFKQRFRWENMIATAEGQHGKSDSSLKNLELT